MEKETPAPWHDWPHYSEILRGFLDFFWAWHRKTPLPATLSVLHTLAPTLGLKLLVLWSAHLNRQSRPSGCSPGRVAREPLVSDSGLGNKPGIHLSIHSLLPRGGAESSPRVLSLSEPVLWP